MIKKYLLFAITIAYGLSAHAADLLDVYQQAQSSDPIYQQAVAQRLANREAVPISVAALFPNISVNASPSVTRTGYAGSNYTSVIGGSPNFLSPRNNTQRAYTLALNVTQTVFNFAQFSGVAAANASAKSADAALNAALQDLMLRVSKAYFAVLHDEENLSYNHAAKLAYKEQLDQAREQYKVGLKTITDVYTAQASYDSSVASYIAAQTTLSNDRENLRVITGKYYDQLSSLSDDFPLITPEPNNIDEWVKIAQLQNWTIKQLQYSVDAARQNIHQQFAGHLPTVNVTGTVNRMYTDNINGYNSFDIRNGPGSITNREVALNITMPVFAGGGVVAETNQASYNYQASEQQLEQTVRNTINNTRQSYLGITSGISKITADKEAIKSAISSLEGMQASYKVGTETLVDVLNQQKQVFQSQTQYAADRYDFVTNILLLKQAAGTLSFNDLRAINTWLMDDEIKMTKHPKQKTALKQKVLEEQRA